LNAVLSEDDYAQHIPEWCTDSTDDFLQNDKSYLFSTSNR